MEPKRGTVRARLDDDGTGVTALRERGRLLRLGRT